MLPGGQSLARRNGPIRGCGSSGRWGDDLRRDRNRGRTSDEGGDTPGAWDEDAIDRSPSLMPEERYRALLRIPQQALDETRFQAALEASLNRDLSRAWDNASYTAIHRARCCLPQMKPQLSAFTGTWGPEPNDISRFILETEILPDSQLVRRGCNALRFHAVTGRATTPALEVLRDQASGRSSAVSNVILPNWMLDVLIAACWRNSIDVLHAFAPAPTQRAYLANGWRILEPDRSMYLDMRDSESMFACYERMKLIYVGFGAIDLWESIPG